MDAKNDDRGLEPDDDQALWELLGRARAVAPSPYFVRRVLRDLDADGEAATVGGFARGWRAWFRPGWILAASGAAAVLVAVLGVLSFSSVPVAPPAPVARRSSVTVPPSFAVVAPSAAVSAPAVAAVPKAQTAPTASAAVFQIPADVRPQDVDVIADLDNLVAREETNAWTDDTSRF